MKNTSLSSFGIVGLGLFTMIAFAANSVLCRVALNSGELSPTLFTGLRISAGAVFLLPLLVFRGKSARWAAKTSLVASLALFTYALFFSLAYVSLDSGSGALILFGAVQVTMIGLSLLQGHRLSQVEGLGMGLALSGLFYLLGPSAQGPSLQGGLLMMIAGIAWGVYSVIGKGEPRPMLATARNFLLAGPLGVLLVFWSKTPFDWTSSAVQMALVSGALTSGLGYLLWYWLLQFITVPVASVLQLSVPPIAAFGGLLFAAEEPSFELVVSTVVILSGILLTLFGRKGKAH